MRSKLSFDDMKEFEKWCYTQGLGSGLVRKLGSEAPQETLSTTTWWNVIYGRKVWSQLNEEANAFALLPKKPWDSSGFRVKTAHQGSPPDGGVSEGAAVPSAAVPTYAEVYHLPKTVWHGFDASEVADFISGVDDSIDLLAQLREDTGIYHALSINYMLLDDVDDVANTTTNFETIDKYTGQYTETSAVNNPPSAADLIRYGNGSALNPGASTWTNCTATSWAAAERDLTLALIDGVLADLFIAAGGKGPNVILTGYDTLMAWQQLLESERRFMEAKTVIPSYGGVQGILPGVEAGFMVATYQGVPILESFAETDNTGTLSAIHFLNTEYMWFSVAKPTQYFELRDMLALGRLKIEGAFRTMGDLRCNFFKAQAKLRDIK
jgi:hypothetical protein